MSGLSLFRERQRSSRPKGGAPDGSAEGPAKAAPKRRKLFQSPPLVAARAAPARRDGSSPAARGPRVLTDVTNDRSRAAARATPKRRARSPPAPTGADAGAAAKLGDRPAAAPSSADAVGGPRPQKVRRTASPTGVSQLRADPEAGPRPPVAPAAPAAPAPPAPPAAPAAPEVPAGASERPAAEGAAQESPGSASTSPASGPGSPSSPGSLPPSPGSAPSSPAPAPEKAPPAEAGGRAPKSASGAKEREEDAADARPTADGEAAEDGSGRFAALAAKATALQQGAEAALSAAAGMREEAAERIVEVHAKHVRSLAAAVDTCAAVEEAAQALDERGRAYGDLEQMMRDWQSSSWLQG